MPIVTQCTAEGCTTLTIGPWCVEHDPTVAARAAARRRRAEPGEEAVELVAEQAETAYSA